MCTYKWCWWVSLTKLKGVYSASLVSLCCSTNACSPYTILCNLKSVMYNLLNVYLRLRSKHYTQYEHSYTLASRTQACWCYFSINLAMICTCIWSRSNSTTSHSILLETRMGALIIAVSYSTRRIYAQVSGFPFLLPNITY
jgi:hypothetical protein